VRGLGAKAKASAHPSRHSSGLAAVKDGRGRCVLTSRDAYGRIEQEGFLNARDPR